MFALKWIPFFHPYRALWFGTFFSICILSAILGCGNEGEGGGFRPTANLFDEALWRDPPSTGSDFTDPFARCSISR